MRERGYPHPTPRIRRGSRGQVVGAECSWATVDSLDPLVGCEAWKMLDIADLALVSKLQEEYAGRPVSEAWRFVVKLCNWRGEGDGPIEFCARKSQWLVFSWISESRCAESLVFVKPENCAGELHSLAVWGMSGKSAGVRVHRANKRVRNELSARCRYAGTQQLTLKSPNGVYVAHLKNRFGLPRETHGFARTGKVGSYGHVRILFRRHVWQLQTLAETQPGCAGRTNPRLFEGMASSGSNASRSMVSSHGNQIGTMFAVKCGSWCVCGKNGR